MEKKMFRKKLLILLMIISIVATDFFILGSNLLTYSSDISDETNNPNVEFSAYFKNDAGERADSVEKSIKDDNLKLYAEIIVKNEGYLNEGTAIEIEDSNFKFKSNILSPYIREISGNKVVLKQITAGETAEIELDIEPIISDKMSVDMLSKISIVKLNGSYTGSTESGIQYGKEVCIEFLADETAMAELKTEIITNKVIAISGTNKRVIQTLVKSRLIENQYPVEQTKLNISIPQLGEETAEVNVMAIGTVATNGEKQLSTDAWTTQNGKVEIVIKNDVDTSNQIKWNKNVYDQIVVTYIYPETVDASKIEIETNSELKLYNSEKTYTATDIKSIENQELNNVIMGKTEITTQEMYKGQIYANIDAPYNTKTTLIVTNPDVVDEIVVHESANTFETEESELVANTKYITTQINLQKMLEILGQDGNITIKNGETTKVINKDSEVNESGNVIINYENSTTELDIITSKPESTGILEVYHTKVITENDYTRKQLQAVKKLKVTNTTTATLNEVEIVSNTTEPEVLELKETISKAELIIDKTNLSATEPNEVTVGIKLITDSTQYDLYKNPKMKLQLPAAVRNVEFANEPSKLYSDGFETITQNYDSTNNIITVNIEGEQTAYSDSTMTQPYIQLKLNITLDSLALAQTDKIKMAYKNENATQYEGGTTEYGVVEQNIEISAPSQLIKTFNVSSNENTSLTETILNKIENSDAGKVLDFEIGLLNNKDTNINNVKILGKLPTTGNTIADKTENTLETTLSNITAENATIYYTENVNATEDIDDSTNGWTQEFLTSAKLYLIKIDSLERGSNYTATISVKTQDSLAEGMISYTQYEVIYDTITETNRENSRIIGLVTSIVAKIETTITAKVGQDEINNGDLVKEGEVIKYTATIENNSVGTLTDVQLKLNVPEGTTYVRTKENSDNSTGFYYEEITDSDEVAQLTNITIPELKTTEPYIIEYEVRVNKGTAGGEILNNAIVIYESQNVGEAEFKNIIEESNIRVTIKRGENAFVDGVSANADVYVVYVENLSNSVLENIELQVKSNAFELKRIDNDIGDVFEGAGPITITEIAANSASTFMLFGLIDETAIKVSTAAIVTDSIGNIYRSNAVEEKIFNIDASIGLMSAQDGKEIKPGDIVEYNITVKNTGDIASEFVINDIVSGYMSIESIQIIQGNENTTKQSIDSNQIYETVTLDVGETVRIYITSRVNEFSEDVNGTNITNVASVENENMHTIFSETVTHILKLEDYITPDDSDIPGDNEEPKDDSEGTGDITPEDPTDKGEDKEDDKTPEEDSEGKENIIPEDPSDKEDNETPEEDSSVKEETYIITGLAWLDKDKNGQKDVDEEGISGINVKILDVKTHQYLTNSEGKVIETTTEEKGKYTFSNVKKGSYIVVFEYDIEKYEPTIYMAEGIDTTINSKVISSSLSVNGKDAIVAVTDTINVQKDIENINIGLQEKLKFDLELNKYISRIVVQTAKETKVYDYENDTFEKVEIHRKQIQGALVVLEYTIKVKNSGEIAGYAKNIVDYLPNALTFTSELNKDWYISGNYLYTKALENVQINPGEEKELKLILTKTMTTENIGLINNRAEIYQDYNKYGGIDIDSTPNNQVQNEDDIGSADVIIGIATGGGMAYILLIIINIFLIGLAIKIMIKNDIIKIEYRRGRGEK